MLNSQIIEQIKNAITPVLEKNEFCLVQMSNFYQGNTLFLKILVDKYEGGISLDECAHLNNEISIILDEKNILQSRYILEVSSPALDRPLKTESDFLRCINRKVRLLLAAKINGKIEWEGIITQVESDLVYIDIDDEIIKIPLSKINKAKQVINNI